MTPAKRRAAVAVAAIILVSGCEKASSPSAPDLVGAPSTPEYVAVQAGDVPPGLVRCRYSGTMSDYLEQIKGRSEKGFASISSTWAALQASGGTEGYVAVYAETEGACEVWVTGEGGSHVRGGSRVVSAVVVKFPDAAVAESAYKADIFKQSALNGRPGLRVLVGSATGLGPNAIVGADEAANPAVHQAVWQNGNFNVFFTSRNLTRPEFTSATSLANRRTA